MNYFYLAGLLGVVVGPIVEEVPNKEEIVVSTPQEITGKVKQPQIILPNKSLGVIAIAAEAPGLEDGVTVIVTNRISKDGGKTWDEFGKFTCSPPPWYDKTKCELMFIWNDAKGQPIQFPDGTILESDLETKDKFCRPEDKACNANDKKGTVGLTYTVGKAL